MEGNGGEKLKSFCLQTFEMLGAGVSEAYVGVWSVSIPSSMIDLFEGRPSLKIAFDPEHIREKDVDLVVPGSYVLERILEAVRRRGSTAQVTLRPSSNPSPTPGIKLLNAQAKLESTEVSHLPLVILTYRISLITDENEDRMYQAVIDPSTGETLDKDPLELLSVAHVESMQRNHDDKHDLSQAFKAGRNAAEKMASEWAKSIQLNIDARLEKEISRLDKYYNDLLNDSISRGAKEEIIRLRKRKDKAVSVYKDEEHVFELARELVLLQNETGTNLADLIFQKRTAILRQKPSFFREMFFGDEYYNKAMATDHELKLFDEACTKARKLMKFTDQERITKLEEQKQKSLEVVKMKWDTQVAENFDGNKIGEVEQLQTHLRAEKAQRIGELKDKFRLKVLVTPVSVCIVQSPVMECRYNIVNDANSIPFTSRLDMVTGKAKAGSCPTCGGTMESAYICSCGKMACSGCTKTCAVCMKTLCLDHIRTCPLCNSTVCLDDMRTCAECGVEGCKIDVSDCPSCGKAVCIEHSNSCQLCGQRTCKDCLTPSGYCKTCSGLFRSRISVSAARQITEELANAQPRRLRRWFITENPGQFIITRSGPIVSVYIVDKSSYSLRSQRQLGFMESLRAKIRLFKD